MTLTNTLTVTTPSDHEIVVARSFAAPRRFVFEAFTKPELLKRWMGGMDGWNWVVCEIDPRAGGKFRYVWNGPGGMLLEISGTMIEVTPTRIVHHEYMKMEGGQCCTGGDGGAGGMSAEPAKVTTEFAENAGITTVTMTIYHASKDVRDAMLKSGMTDGMSLGYAKLDEVLAEMK